MINNFKKILIMVLLMLLLTGCVNSNKKSSMNIQTYKVTFDSNGGSSVVSQKVEYENQVVKPSVPSLKGYTFVEWQLNNTTYDFNLPVKNNITLKAIWKKNIYSITFNSDGGTIINKQNIEYESKVAKPNNPSKDGYEFVEWQLNGKTYDFNLPVENNIKLKAVWKKKVYNISFNSDGGTIIKNQNIQYGSKVSKPNTPSKDGYEFVEWQLNGKTYDFNLPVKSNITLKAVWIKNIFSVTFNSNGGSNIDSQKVNKGNTVNKPTNPSKDGYEFVEWQLNGTTYNFDAPVTSDITLIVKWKKTVFNVGDELSIADEEFYVIRLFGNQLTLLAKYTLGPNYRQSSIDNPVKFANNKSWGYGGEINVPAGPVRTYLDEYLKYLNVVTNNNIQEVDLMSISTPKGFGLNLLHEFCYTNSHIFHNGQDYWTSTGVEGSSYLIHYISGTRCMESEASYEGKLGVRPIIKINKDYFQ